jgi:hypothetical protein
MPTMVYRENEGLTPSQAKLDQVRTSWPKSRRPRIYFSRNGRDCWEKKNRHWKNGEYDNNHQLVLSDFSVIEHHLHLSVKKGPAALAWEYFAAEDYYD